MMQRMLLNWIAIASLVAAKWPSTTPGHDILVWLGLALVVVGTLLWRTRAHVPLMMVGLFTALLAPAPFQPWAPLAGIVAASALVVNLVLWGGSQQAPPLRAIKTTVLAVGIILMAVAMVHHMAFRWLAVAIEQDHSATIAVAAMPALLIAAGLGLLRQAMAPEIAGDEAGGRG